MKTVDFYYDYSSTNSYFAAFLLPEIARRHDARVNWLPIHLAALFRGTGFDVMAMTPRKARYLWRDHQRYAAMIERRNAARLDRKRPIAILQRLRGSAHRIKRIGTICQRVGILGRQIDCPVVARQAFFMTAEKTECCAAIVESRDMIRSYAKQPVARRQGVGRAIK